MCGRLAGTGLPWERRLPSPQALIAPNLRSGYSSRRSPGEGGNLSLLAQVPTDHRISPRHSSLLCLPTNQGPQSTAPKAASPAGSRRLGKRGLISIPPVAFSRPHGDSWRLPIPQLQPTEVLTTQPPPPTPQWPSLEPSSLLCPGAALAAVGTGAALPRHAALSCMLASTASATSAAARGRPAPGSPATPPGDPL